ncbi:MAG: hypothetical protein OES46_03380 [Gammaproteobacteria bacterium]|jgi:hypothetical protein|nr:hypothetical protein [Gammaproteobacteria bacterium]
MALEHGVRERSPTSTQARSNWGAKLFFAILFAVLVFFWWLLIYSGGVTGHHG